MRLIITQDDTNTIDYLAEISDFLRARGINTKEQLDSRFDVMLAEFAIQGGHNYNAVKKELNIND